MCGKMPPIYIFTVGLLIITKTGLCFDNSSAELGHEQYDNYSLVRVTPQDARQAQAVRALAERGAGLQVLKHSRGLNDSLDLLVPAAARRHLARYALDNGLNLIVKHQDFRRSLDESLRSSNRRALRSFDLFSYNSFDSIQEYLNMVAAKHPKCVRLEKVGGSFEHRPLRLVKISSDPSAHNSVIFIDAGIHAREWVAPAMALYLVDRIAQSCSLGANDPQSMLRGVDWYILPVVNPDGYEYSRTHNRLWRKTRSRHRSGCRGVDGNRNYGFRWGVSGTSSNPCDPQTYPGPRPFSETETRAVRDVMMSHAAAIKLYVSLHAYGQYLVYPWGYTGSILPKSWKSLDGLAHQVSAAVARAGGEPFKVLSAGKWYAAAGGSDDYAFGVAKIPYSYTMELTDGYEFDFPEDRLRDVLPKFYEGFKVFQKQIYLQFGRN